MKKGWVALLALGALSGVFLPTFATAEVRIGNGGDALAAQFVETADDLVQIIDAMRQGGNMTLPDGFQMESFRNRVALSKVFSSEKTFLGSVEVDALNYPSEKKIVFNRTRFSRLVFNLKAQRTLVAHEYMGLAGIDDSTYKYSNYLVRKTMNGGDKGELWLLKDLLLPGFQNPFRTPALDVSTDLFSSSGTRQHYFQNGIEISAAAVQPREPYCVISTGAMQGDTSVRSIRVGISTAEVVDTNGLGTEVQLRMQRAAVVPALRCASGSSWRRVALGDMLNSFGNAALFSHEGISALGNVNCR